MILLKVYTAFCFIVFIFLLVKMSLIQIKLGDKGIIPRGKRVNLRLLLKGIFNENCKENDKEEIVKCIRYYVWYIRLMYSLLAMYIFKLIAE